MECPQWDDDAPVLVSWSQETVRSPVQEFLADYGMFIFSGIAIIGLSTFLWKKAGDTPGFDQFPPYIRDASTGEVSFMEL